MNESILTVRGLSKKFSGIEALKEISLDICENSIHCIVGENGAGKSTLITDTLYAALMQGQIIIICPHKFCPTISLSMLAGSS